MNVTADHLEIARIDDPHESLLPESLRASSALLVAGDALGAVVAIVICGLALHAAIAAFFTVTATGVIGAAIGRYRQSFAVSARDEWYAAAGTGACGAVVGALLSLTFGFAWPAALLAGALWILCAGVAAERLHRMRRGGHTYAGVATHVRTTPHQPAWEIEQALVRVVDVVLAFVALIVLSPVMLIMALAVTIDDRGPALFGQRRVGRDDRDFTMYKVRTMRVDADERWVASDDDSRITRVGAVLRRTSLDELPQLFNVLRGEMSLVGPRPEMQEYAERFNAQLDHYWQRHRVRPGITGWAQLYLPRTVTPADAPAVLAHDLFYVEHVGLYLYFTCLMKTAAEIFSHRAR